MPLGMLFRKLGLEKIRPMMSCRSSLHPDQQVNPRGHADPEQHCLESGMCSTAPESVCGGSAAGSTAFFHSFGYTVAMWLPLCADPGAAYHFNPLDARIVGKLTEKYKCTILLATPTFLRFRTLNAARLKNSPR